MTYREYQNWGHFSRLEICKGWKALNVGCGDGYEVAYLRSLGVEAYGFDNGSQGYQLARENFFAADARDIPCKNDCFDLILCLQVIQHIPENIQLVKEIKRVLKKEGKLVITATNKYGITLISLRIAFRKTLGIPPRFYFEYEKFYKPKELVNILKNSGFKIVTTYTTGFIPYRLRSYQHFGEYIVGLLFWLEKNIISKIVILKDIGSKIVIVAEKK